MTKITTATPSRLGGHHRALFYGGPDGRVGSAGGGDRRRLAQAFALDKMQMGWIFSAGVLSLLPGALVGGMLADRHGRKRILLGSVLLFGLFSLPPRWHGASRRCCWRACSPASGSGRHCRT